MHFFVWWLKISVFIQNTKNIFIKIGLLNTTQLLGLELYQYNPFLEMH